MEAIHVDEEHPANAGVLRYLGKRGTDKPLSATPDSARDPYMGLGSHPDIVTRVWDELGKALPADCRCIVRGSPALVHPKSGVVLALAIGTQYGLRLPQAEIEQAVKQGAKTITTWAGGRQTNIAEEFGPDWIFGGWFKDEPRWCQAVYTAFDNAS